MMQHPVKEYLAIPAMEEESANGSPLPTMTWKPVVHQLVPEGVYEVSDNGIVANKVTGKLLKNRPAGAGGNLVVSLKGLNESGVTSMRVDKMVLMAFRGESGVQGFVPIHADGDTNNCHLINLSWGPPPEGERAPAGSARPKKKRTKKRAPAPAGGPQVEAEVSVDRRYRFRGVVLEVHQDGSVDLTIPGSSRTVRMAPTTFAALARVVARADEMNKLVGP
jgi:hypothetical protein